MGYKTEQFVKRVDENLYCPICYEVFRDPVSCKDGHAYCRECINTWLKTRKTCPLDNTFLEQKNLVRGVITVKNIIDNLDVYCQPPKSINCNESPTKKRKLDTSNEMAQYLEELIKKTKCDWIGKLQFLEKHRKTCLFQNVCCPYVNCNTMIQRRELKDHKRTCNYRIVTCMECREEIVACQLQSHKDNSCPETMVLCIERCFTNGQITRVKRIDLVPHLQKHCGNVSVNCSFADQGCSERILRKYLTKHLHDKAVEHTLLVAQQNNLLKEEIKKLKEEMSNCYLWTIHNYRFKSSQYHNGTFIRSTTFWLSGYKWFLRLHPNGETPATQKFIALCLVLEDTTKDTPRNQHASDSVSVTYKLSVTSRVPGTDDISKEKKFNFFPGNCSGWCGFMKTSDVLSPTYCNSTNGSLTIKCTILLDKPQ